MEQKSTNNSTILMLGEVFHAKEEFSKLWEYGEIAHITSGCREEFISKCRNGSFDRVKVISRTVESSQFTGLFDCELINALPSSVKFICHNGAGFDQINVPACHARGITVSNTPGSVDAATANVAIFLMLGAMRRAWIAQTAVRNGKWRGDSPIGHDPEGKILGILGMGGIGSAVAARAMGFGMRIQYHNRRVVEHLTESFPPGVEPPKYVDLDELLSTSDIISIHLPLNSETRHSIGKREFSKMKQGVILVNTARGAIMDEQALVEALSADNKIWSVGLDVYENEPEIHPRLLSDDRVMLLPHIGTATVETQKKMEVQVIENVRSAITRGNLLNPVKA